MSGWIFLIVSLLAGIDLYPFNVNRCGGSPDCHSLEGNQIFWGMVVPGCLLLLVVFSHELWRRVCPLALVSQLFRILGMQRTVGGRGGRRAVAKVEPGSWLGRHHVALQWSLFIAGLCLRLLLVNSNTLGLGLLLLFTAVAALVVGWAYGGKAWCQYVCPMGPVQTIITGPRSFFGSPAHIETTAKVTQSMCRTVSDSGKVQSACVACQTPCIDIDSERSYWSSLKGKRGLNWAWGSYPGLVLAFFLIIKLESRGGLDYLRSGMWAYDNEVTEYAWSPLVTGPWIPVVPRLVAIPVLLVLAAWISVALQRWLQQLQQRQLTPDFGERAQEVAIHRTRLLASFLAVNIFFWFADPTLGLLGPAGGQVIRSVVLIVSGMWVHRGWYRERATYLRESTSASLRRQLEQLIPDLSPYLDGRSIDELSAAEVFTLVKVLPAQISQTKRSLYKGVMAELLVSGRLEQATALVQLEELRQSLKLDDDDHWAAIQELALQDRRILELTGQQREIRSLRQDAAREAMLELLRLARLDDLQQLLADPHVRDNLSRIRRDFLLDEASWQELVDSFGPGSDRASNTVRRPAITTGEQAA
ncbi:MULTISPECIES: 4Fe-4S binding protein [Synechococcales]|uniref:4Fe-4S binding protein n=1 Tax=Synechococcus sp. CS-1333 TaxID=2848638 RepID=UPI00223AE3A5|nr:4Fe-4S binding protein [Synechococcus sp. CS-1333]MCT0210581.1 4Fe-4S binding protein [Synechococcus sp. CS-1333]